MTEYIIEMAGVVMSAGGIDTFPRRSRARANRAVQGLQALWNAKRTRAVQKMELFLDLLAAR